MVTISKVYGQLDADPKLLEAVLAFAEQRGAQAVTIVAHQRVPLGSSMCKKPGSVTYEVLLDSNTRAFAARQLSDGSIQCPFRPFAS